MSEKDLVERTPSPLTRARLTREFRALGVKPGMTIITHSSLSSLGWVCGGPITVVQALMDALTPDGTLMMPTQSAGNSEPSNWSNPPVPREWWQIIRDTMPAYDPRITPTRSMGAIVEAFRTFPGVMRSSHPAVSFAAWGKHAQALVGSHSLDYPFGEGSPLARLYELDGWILLLGVGYDSNTSMHLAEHRAPGQVPVQQGAALYENGERVWKVYQDIEVDSDIFPQIGADFEQHTNLVIIGHIGLAETKLIPMRPLVDFTVEWFTERRRHDS
uniref:Aminoglycoside N(3)-acetyltransferase n=1 Tax=Thermosporothrix sp. COM3 TaxID=2490863 RepID=A0A455SFA8_9CHLR|nr:AAC(3) family N-acetyltransferase [Thermosporothrix sp. COM3]